jgi:hypothetical protein
MIRMIQCPQCGNTADFAFDAWQCLTAYVHQVQEDEAGPGREPGYLEITDTRCAAMEWDENGMCRCVVCQHMFPLAAFALPPRPGVSDDPATE